MTEHVKSTSGQGTTIAVDDVELYYDDQGAGDVVVLLHGGIMDHQSWGNQIDELAKDFRVISPDTRAHGRSTDSAKLLTYQQFADDTVELLDKLGVTRAHVIGFSDGGCTALLLGIQHPDLVDRIVLLGTPYHTSNYPAGTAEHFATITTDELFEMVGGDSAFGEVVRKAQAVSPSTDAWQSFWTKLVNGLWSREPNLRLEQLAAISAPTLILHAENEQFYDRSHSEDMQRTIPDSRLEIIPDATHTSPQENPAAVNAAIVGFLS